MYTWLISIIGQFLQFRAAWYGSVYNGGKTYWFYLSYLICDRIIDLKLFSHSPKSTIITISLQATTHFFDKIFFCIK